MERGREWREGGESDGWRIITQCFFYLRKSASCCLLHSDQVCGFVDSVNPGAMISFSSDLQPLCVSPSCLMPRLQQ